MENWGWGWREGRSFEDIFLFSVDGRPLIYIPNRVLVVTHQSLSSGVISHISQLERVGDFGCWHLVNHRARGVPAVGFCIFLFFFSCFNSKCYFLSLSGNLKITCLMKQCWAAHMSRQIGVKRFSSESKGVRGGSAFEQVPQGPFSNNLRTGWN